MTGHATVSSSETNQGQGLRTVREEFPEHESVIRFGVVLRDTDVFIHIERYDMLEAREW